MLVVDEFSSGIVAAIPVKARKIDDSDKVTKSVIKDYKQVKDGPVTYLPNFSSLFTSNPTIPNIKRYINDS